MEIKTQISIAQFDWNEQENNNNQEPVKQRWEQGKYAVSETVRNKLTGKKLDSIFFVTNLHLVDIGGCEAAGVIKADGKWMSAKYRVNENEFIRTIETPSEMVEDTFLIGDNGEILDADGN